jgi:hypothetical protein
MVTTGPAGGIKKGAVTSALSRALSGCASRKRLKYQRTARHAQVSGWFVWVGVILRPMHDCVNKYFAFYEQPQRNRGRQHRRVYDSKKSTSFFANSLILDSGVLCDQYLNECTQQRFASLADVVHKLKETEVEWEFLLGYAPMGTQPTP